MIRVSGIESTLKHVERTLNNIKNKQRDFLEKLAEIGIETANVRFANAQYDGTNDAVVNAPEWDGDNKLIISATGRAVAFIEFGTGVHYTESHPKAAEFGAIRGSYGYGLGKLDQWRYKGDPGTNGEVITEGKHKGEVLTHGNPPARAMYEAGKDMREHIREIAQEVFSND